MNECAAAADEITYANPDAKSASNKAARALLFIVNWDYKEWSH